MRHCLLPRSTGLLFCLRALAARVPHLELVDLTIGYEGIPATGYGQDYYTLQSTFGAGQPPPAVHLHYRTLPVSSIPIGTLPTSSNGSIAQPTEQEKRDFEAWLLERWREKDDLLAHFYNTGSFANGPGVAEGDLTCPLVLSKATDWLSLFGGMAVPVVGLSRLVRAAYRG